MSVPTPRALPENAGLAFVGEAPWPPALLTAGEAKRLLAARNICGRPNRDVLRRRLAVVEGEPAESWQIDFPTHFTAQESALYEQPWAWLHRRAGGNWQNPHSSPSLRRALARVSRWLAMPVDAEAPDWRWIEDDLLPDASLAVVVRDDDFTQGVLSSPAYAAWHASHRSWLAPASLVESFPFPWPPGTPLSALTKAQEEHRHAIARAARSGDTVALGDAVSAAYGWPSGLAERNVLGRLAELARGRGT